MKSTKTVVIPQPLRVQVRKVRNCFALRYLDPVSQRYRVISTSLAFKSSNRNAAYRQAVELETQLRGLAPTGSIEPPKQVDISVSFRNATRQFIREKKPTSSFSAPVASLESYLTSQHLPISWESITSAILTDWLLDLKNTRRPATVHNYFANIRRLYNWSKRRFPELSSLPELMVDHTITKIPAKDRTRGGPVSDEALQSIIDAAVDVCPSSELLAWVRLMNILRFTGTRLNEALELTWQTPGNKCELQIIDNHFQIHFHSQKNGKDEIVPCAPDAEAYFRTLALTTGKVVALQTTSPLASTMISKCAKSAGIYTGSGAKRNHVTPHDFRKSFAQRWAKCVKPLELMKMMRHSQIDTTLRHYVTADIQALRESMNQGLSSD